MIDIPVPNSDFRKLTFSSRIRYKGASIYYVRKIFGILDPLPPLSLHFTQPISTVIRKFGQLLNPLPPSQCERNKWIAPNLKCSYSNKLDTLSPPLGPGSIVSSPSLFPPNGRIVADGEIDS